MESGVLILLAVVAYFLPSAIAITRTHHSGPAIFALNLFLGWTFLGWFVAFIWSLTGTGPAQPAAAPAPGPAEPKTPRPAPAKTKACPACAEDVKVAARVCRFCGHEFRTEPHLRAID